VADEKGCSHDGFLVGGGLKPFFDITDGSLDVNVA
jgi:hypothetical protein